MFQLTLALDWTPNINHIGFFVAQGKGFYQEEGLQVSLLDPSADNYATTPAKKIELGIADMALCPTESVISYRTKAKPFDLIGIATLFQEDVSAIATLVSSSIERPKELDGRSYASYQARYEDQIVRQMIANDGGKGELQVAYPSKLGIWETLVKGEFDSTWIFTNWEGVEAETSGIDLHLFRMKDFGIPYSYSPLLVASQKRMLQEKNTYHKFLKACRKGFLFCREHAAEAVEILQPYLPESDKHIDLDRALELSVPSFGNGLTWGGMQESTVAEFLNWIYKEGLETQPLQIQDLITNELLG
ncbi:MAG: ABC transporter substrate-binding protein [Salibacteraceae bacterium]